MTDWLSTLAERRIDEAMRGGMFDNLPGAGSPLDPGDDALVPEDLRVAYRVLKNAGFVPPEVAARREIGELLGLLATVDDEPTRRRAATRVALLEARLEQAGRSIAGGREYRAAIIARFDGTAESSRPCASPDG